MTWSGTLLRRATEAEIDADKGKCACTTVRCTRHYLIETVNTDSGEVRRGLFCIAAAAGIAYRLGMAFPPAPVAHVH